MQKKIKVKKMVETTDLCIGEPSYGSECPNRMFCDPYIQYQKLMKHSMHRNQNVSYISAFYCSSKDWHKFKQADPESFEPFIILSNDMIIRHSGKSPKNEMEIYKVVVPANYAHSLLYDGVNFFVSEFDDLLSPGAVLPNVSIKNKGTK